MKEFHPLPASLGFQLYSTSTNKMLKLEYSQFLFRFGKSSIEEEILLIFPGELVSLVEGQDSNFVSVSAD